MGRADLHVHSLYSIDGTDTVAEILEYAAYHANLDVIAIADHDDLRGSLEALQLCGKYGIDVVPAIELTTLEGHVLALFVEQPIPSHRPLIEAILRIGEAGGLAVIPHPNSRLAHSLTHDDIRRVAADPDASQVLVGIEVFTGCLLVNSQTAPLRGLAHQLHLCEVAGSDAHVRELIGSGVVRFSGLSAADLRKALVNRQVTPIVRFSPTGAQIALTWTKKTLARRRDLLKYARQVSTYRAGQKRGKRA
ncbi:MAG: PHP domain-containing protein [Anaerolineales bacterium]